MDTSAMNDGALPIHMGEATDFERIFLLYHAPLRYYCEQLTGVEEECEDIVSHLFLKLWQKQVEFKSAAHAQAYLYRSAKNACINFIRNGKTAFEKEEVLSSTSTEFSENHLDVIIRTEVWAELYRAIAGLPPQSRKVITMSYLEGMSNQEIADEMNLSLQTVKNHKVRGLSLLKEGLPDASLILLFSCMLLK
ncbi:RNA polymerase sigma-70 factor [Mucilaginibacter pineti]|nr:RNA polymerase sigma-70 factor [Mucilaginibacter pineti]